MSNPCYILTRTEPKNQELAASLRRAGSRVLSINSIALREVPIGADLQSKLQEKADYLLLTSANAVRYFEPYASVLLAANPQIKVLCIGQTTAAAAKRVINLRVDFIPQTENIESLLAELELSGQSVFYPCAKVTALADLSDRLARQDNILVKFVCYQTCKGTITEAVLKEIRELPIGQLIFVFYSPSAARFTRALIGPDCARQARAIVKGSTTARGAAEFDFLPTELKLPV